MHSNVVKERRSQKFPWSSRRIEYFSTGLSLAFVQVFSVLFSHFILQPRTIRRARRLCGRKEPLKTIENIGKKNLGEREKKRQENAVSESTGLSSDDGAKMASKNLGIFSAKERFSESRKRKSNSFRK